MDHTGRARHARALRTPSVGGDDPAGRRHDPYPAVVRDRRWRRELFQHPSAAVRELGRVVVSSAGGRPLLARPVIWQSGVGGASPAWHALAVTDRFVVKIDLTITDAGAMKTFASVVRFIDVADVQGMSQDLEAGVTLRFGSAKVTPPSPGADSADSCQPPPAELAVLDAVTSHVAS